MKPTYEELVEKLQELTNILEDQNQDDSYDESIGHVVTEATDLLDRAKPAPVKVKRWLRSGELDDSATTQEQILEQCGRLLDKSCSHEILGEVLFEGEDDGYYVVTVEALMQSANPEYVKFVQQEIEEEE